MSEEGGLTEKDVALFREVYGRFSSDVDPGFFDLLVHGVEKTVFLDGQEMLREGDEGDFLLIICRGKALVEVGGVRVGEVKEGGLLGESVLMGSTVRRTATVRAVGVVTAFTLARHVVQAGFDEFPDERQRIEAMIKVRERANKALTGSNSGNGNSGNGGGNNNGNSGNGQGGNNNGQKGGNGGGVSGAMSDGGRVSHTRSAEEKTNHLRNSVFRKSGLLAVKGGTRLRVTAKRSSLTGLEQDDEDEMLDARSRCSARSSGSAGDSLHRQIRYGTGSLYGSEASSVPRAYSKELISKTRRGKRQLLWAKRRAESIEKAPLKQECRQVISGEVLPQVPPARGYLPPQEEKGPAGGPWTKAVKEVQAFDLRYQRASSLYQPGSARSGRIGRIPPLSPPAPLSARTS